MTFINVWLPELRRNAGPTANFAMGEILRYEEQHSCLEGKSINCSR